MLSPAFWFKKRQNCIVTYESGGNKTAVDMILIKRAYKKRIMIKKYAGICA